MKTIMGAILLSTGLMAQTPSFAELCTAHAECEVSQVDSQRRASTLSTIESNNELILQVATNLDINPVVVAGVILAEQAVNFDISDSIQGVVASMRLTSHPITGREFSFGLAQIKISTAMSAEGMYAELEGRSSKSQDEVRQALLTDEGAIYYAAGVLKVALDAVEAAGGDISNIGIAATVYSLTNPAEKALNGELEVNYVGAYVVENADEIEAALGL